MLLDKLNCQEKVSAATADLNFSTTCYTVHMNTTAGPMTMEVFPDVAPAHAANFVALAQIGFYNDLEFHRVISGFVIQGGCPRGDGTGGPGYKVPAEFSDRPHEKGILSMARSQDPDSAGSQFFVCLDQVPYLDGQYTVFGRTVGDDSLATLERIGACQTDGRDRPKEPVKMLDVIVKGTPL
jgi:peptidyl-prolyl cis-trans isomerase B (cyclophilin B)